MTWFLTAIIMHRPSPTVRKSMHGAAVSYWTVFWLVSAQIVTCSCHRGDLLYFRPRHGREHPCLARLVKHVDEKVDFLGF